MKIIRFLLRASLASLVVVATHHVFAQGAFATGFQMGAQAFDNAEAGRRAQAAQVEQRLQFIRRYGRPALDRIDTLEKGADRWAKEAELAMKNTRNNPNSAESAGEIK
jgi:hypothetical protein